MTEGACRYCGKPLGPWCKVTCGRLACQQMRQADAVRRVYYRRRHGTEPPPRDPRLCIVCGKPLPSDAHGGRRYHQGFCTSLRGAERGSWSYAKHRDERLAHKRQYAAANRDRVRAYKREYARYCRQREAARV